MRPYLIPAGCDLYCRSLAQRKASRIIFYHVIIAPTMASPAHMNHIGEPESICLIGRRMRQGAGLLFREAGSEASSHNIWLAT